MQNYPNPFNPETTIRYSVGVPLVGTQGNRKVSPEGYSVRGIPTRGLPLQLSIYNANGQLVKILVNGKQEPGKYSITFNGSNLNSGVYYYKLKTGNKIITNKMILINRFLRSCDFIYKIY